MSGRPQSPAPISREPGVMYVILTPLFLAQYRSDLQAGATQPIFVFRTIQRESVWHGRMRSDQMKQETADLLCDVVGRLETSIVARDCPAIVAWSRGPRPATGLWRKRRSRWQLETVIGDGPSDEAALPPVTSSKTSSTRSSTRVTCYPPLAVSRGRLGFPRGPIRTLAFGFVPEPQGSQGADIAHSVSGGRQLV